MSDTDPLTDSNGASLTNQPPAGYKAFRPAKKRLPGKNDYNLKGLVCPACGHLGPYPTITGLYAQHARSWACYQQHLVHRPSRVAPGAVIVAVEDIRDLCSADLAASGGWATCTCPACHAIIWRDWGDPPRWFWGRPAEPAKTEIQSLSAEAPIQTSLF
jgi:hypothetical protein